MYTLQVSAVLGRRTDFGKARQVRGASCLLMYTLQVSAFLGRRTDFGKARQVRDASCLLMYTLPVNAVSGRKAGLGNEKRGMRAASLGIPITYTITGSPRAHLYVVGMLRQTNRVCPLLFILFSCIFLSLWPFQLYFIP